MTDAIIPDEAAALREQNRLLCDASAAQLTALRRVDQLARNLAARPHDLVSPLTVAAQLRVALMGVVLVPMREGE